MGDFIINFYYKHAPNLLPDVLIHSPFLRQYSLGKCISTNTTTHNNCFLGRTLELVESAHKSSGKHGNKRDAVNKLVSSACIVCIM